MFFFPKPLLVLASHHAIHADYSVMSSIKSASSVASSTWHVEKTCVTEACIDVLQRLDQLTQVLTAAIAWITYHLL